MNENPISAYGSCGHNVRDDIGNCSDHFALVFKYPKNVAVAFSSRQFKTSSAGGIINRMFGSKGTLETEYGGMVRILGDDAISNKLSQDDWQEICDIIINGCKTNKVVPGMIDGITMSGRLLGKHFPIEKGDVNELPNELITIDSL